MNGMVVIEFTPPRDAPAHVRDSIVVKGRPFKVGEKATVSAELAFACQNGMAGWWKVHSGEPKARAPIPVAVPKEVARAQSLAAQSMEVNGARALSALPVLSEGAIKALRQGAKDADKALEDGVFDGEVALIAVLLHTMGEGERAAKYAERAVRVANAKAQAAQ